MFMKESRQLLFIKSFWYVKDRLYNFLFVRFFIVQVLVLRFREKSNMYKVIYLVIELINIVYFQGLGLWFVFLEYMVLGVIIKEEGGMVFGWEINSISYIWIRRVEFFYRVLRFRKFEIVFLRDCSYCLSEGKF